MCFLLCKLPVCAVQYLGFQSFNILFNLSVLYLSSLYRWFKNIQAFFIFTNAVKNIVSERIISCTFTSKALGRSPHLYGSYWHMGCFRWHLILKDCLMNLVSHFFFALNLVLIHDDNWCSQLSQLLSQQKLHMLTMPKKHFPFYKNS